MREHSLKRLESSDPAARSRGLDPNQICWHDGLVVFTDRLPHYLRTPKGRYSYVMDLRKIHIHSPNLTPSLFPSVLSRFEPDHASFWWKVSMGRCDNSLWLSHLLRADFGGGKLAEINWIAGSGGESDDTSGTSAVGENGSCEKSHAVYYNFWMREPGSRITSLG